MKIDRDISFRPRVIAVTSLYLILATAGLFLAFCNLDGRLFWADEAENAVLARNILKFGVPKVDDGVNHISLHGDRFDARDGVWTWSPWLPEYVTAASFAVFGQTTWAGRAPFAFIGWLTVAALGALTWKIYRSHRITLAAMLLLGTSEVFLLHIRQCRYYSITVFAEVLLLYGIYQILTKTKGGPWLVLAGLALQFYCNYTIAAANIPLLLVLAWTLYRQERLKKNCGPGSQVALPPLLISFAILFLISVPWLVFTEVWRQGSAEPHDPWTKTLRFYLVQFHFHFFPWCIVLLPAYGWLVEHFGAKRHAGQTSCPPAISPAVASETANKPAEAASNRASDRFNDSTIQRFNEPALRSFERYLFLLPFLYMPFLFVMSGGYLRYLLPVLPALCVLVASWLFRYVRWTALAVALLMIQCVSNVFSVATDPFAKQYPVRSPLADFVFGTLLPYQDRFTDVLDFFQKHAKPGDTVISGNPEFP